MSGTFKQLSNLKIGSFKWSSRLSSTWFSSSKGVSLYSGLSYGKQKSNQYKDIDKSGTSLGSNTFPMAPVKSIRTFVYTGSPGEVEEDGIHLQYKFEQRSATDESGLEHC